MMNMLEKLKNWFDEMITNFPGISFKYELSNLGLYKVVYFTTEELKSDELYRAILRFEDEMEDNYGDNAPLFCENEEYFRLSKNACTYYKPDKFFSLLIPVSYCWKNEAEAISYTDDELNMSYNKAA